MVQSSMKFQNTAQGKHNDDLKTQFPDQNTN